MTTGALVLAAGQSRRFGRDDKLLAKLHGAALVDAALSRVLGIAGAQRLVVVSSPAVRDVAQARGLACLCVPEGSPQSHSLVAGVRALRALGVTRLLVMLGDMPFVRAADLDLLLAGDPRLPACACLDGQPMPPAIFPESWFDRLQASQGDRGAGALLRDIPPAQRLTLPAEVLRDIDYQGDLDQSGPE